MRRFIPVIAVGLVLLFGCAAEPSRGPYPTTKPAAMQRDTKVVAQGGRAAEAAKELAGGEKPEAPKAEPERPALPRRVIYTADLRLIVQDLTAVEEQIRKLVAEHKGFIAQSESSGRTGAPRDGFWKVRVPVAGFDDFVAGVQRLGVPEKSRTDSKDVSEEFYDLQARIKNKKVEEERLLEHLKKSTGKLDEILIVEREISRVRGEIEQMEGKLKVLADLTELTTVTIHCQEVKDYVPPRTPGFGQNVADTFWGSVEALTTLGKGLVLIGAALVPWLPLLAVIGVPIWLIVRRVNSQVVPTVRAVDEAPRQG